MNDEQIYSLFSDIPGPYRMLCIDSAAVGLYLIQQGHEAAGTKLLKTAISTAGLDAELAFELIKNLPESLNVLAMHAEIKTLF